MALEILRDRGADRDDDEPDQEGSRRAHVIPASSPDIAFEDASLRSPMPGDPSPTQRQMNARVKPGHDDVGELYRSFIAFSARTQAFGTRKFGGVWRPSDCATRSAK